MVRGGPRSPERSSGRVVGVVDVVGARCPEEAGGGPLFH